MGGAPQWNGRLCKLPGCCSGTLSLADRARLIEARLYLSKAWKKKQRRCDAADIPDAHRVHKTEIELALAIVLHACRSSVRYESVGIDGGQWETLLRCCKRLRTDQGEIFVADIHSNRQIYTDDPALYLLP